MKTRFAKFEEAGLFEQLWAQPIHEVAARNGVSVEAIDRVAWLLSIPVPPTQHWTKTAKEREAAMPQRPLGRRYGRFSLMAGESDNSTDLKQRFDAEQKRFESRITPLPSMRSSVDDCLPIIQSMGTIGLSGGSNDAKVTISGSVHFEVSVSKEKLERALLTFDRILRHCQGAGLEWTHYGGERDSATIDIYFSSYSLRIFETLRPEGAKLAPTNESESDWPPEAARSRLGTENRTTMLKFQVAELNSHRKRVIEIADAVNAPLGDRIEQVPARMHALALQRMLDWERHKLVSIREVEARAVTARKAAVKREQLARLEEFEAVASEVWRAERLRRLAAAMKDSGRFESESGRDQINWIQNAADWIDPVIKKRWPEVDDV